MNWFFVKHTGIFSKFVEIPFSEEYTNITGSETTPDSGAVSTPQSGEDALVPPFSPQ